MTVLTLSAELGIVATAAALLIIAGGIDLSVGSMIGFAGVVIGLAVREFGFPLWGGIAAAFAMALGTGLTVALLTLAAVTTRGLAVRVAAAGGGEAAHRLHAVVEAAAALAVLLFGLLMLGASLWG